MASFNLKNVLLGSLLIWCLLAGKGYARPSEEEEDPDYLHDDRDGGDDNGENSDENYTGPPPTIRNTPLNLTANPGETVYLPCNTENADSFAVLWMNNSQIFWTDSIKMTSDNRVNKYMNNTVKIERVGPGDSGIYTCEISSDPTVKILHTLHVPSPARIIEMTPKKTVLMKGEPLTLECIVSGYPKPVITWTRKHKRLPSGENEIEASSITIPAVNRHHEGTYECSATNGLGKPVHHSVTIHVHYAPEIAIEKELVNTAEGYESELSCQVHANPKAQVEWLHDGVLVKESSADGVSISGSDGIHHILRLTNTKKNDFGTYVCRAKNVIGNTTKEVKLSGHPTRPMFIKSMHDDDELSEVLEWTVESSSPITEYELQFRKDKMTWESVKPIVENPEGNKYSVKHKLSSLSPGKYEVLIKAKNTYGWSEPSRVHPFSAEPTKDDETTDSAETSKLNGAEDSRPRLFALISVVSLIALLF